MTLHVFFDLLVLELNLTSVFATLKDLTSLMVKLLKYMSLHYTCSNANTVTLYT